MRPAWVLDGMSKPIPLTYETRNWPTYDEALKRRGSLTIWFDPVMTWDATPTGKRGCQPDYSDAAIQTCLTMKVLFGMAFRHKPQGSSRACCARSAWTGRSLTSARCHGARGLCCHGASRL